MDGKVKNAGSGLDAASALDVLWYFEFAKLLDGRFREQAHVNVQELRAAEVKAVADYARHCFKVGTVRDPTPEEERVLNRVLEGVDIGDRKISPAIAAIRVITARPQGPLRSNLPLVLPEEA